MYTVYEIQYEQKVLGGPSIFSNAKKQNFAFTFLMYISTTFVRSVHGV